MTMATKDTITEIMITTKLSRPMRPPPNREHDPICAQRPPENIPWCAVTTSI
jgi:hypothetical protein